MESRTSSAAETDGTNATAGSSLHDVIQVNPVRAEPSQLYVEKLLRSHDWKNEEFKKVLGEYLDGSHNTINYAEAVKKHLDSLQDAEGSSSGVNWEAPLNIFHDQFFDDLDGVCLQQVQMKNSLQSFRDDLSQKLQRAKFWKGFYVLGFTVVVLIAMVAVTAFYKKQSEVLVSALTILPGLFCSWTFSLLKKCDDGATKFLEITGSMASSAQITADVVSSLRLSARQFETQTRSMAESAGAVEERKKSFQELIGNAADFCEYTHSARTCTYDIAKKHIWIPCRGAGYLSCLI